MDINSYSYSPGILDEDSTIARYDNDDMTAYIDNSGTKSNPCFWVSAYSYDGDLEISESFKNETTAKSVFNYIVDNYSDTPPADNEELQKIITEYAKSLLNIVYSFTDYMIITA